MIRAVRLDEVDDALLDWMYELRVAAQAEVAPDAPPDDERDRYAAALLGAPHGEGRWCWVHGGVGYATLSVEAGSALGYVRLYVAAPHRRRGHGRALLDAALLQARAAGCSVVSSLAGTPAAVAFTRAVGGRTGAATIRSALTLPADLTGITAVPGYHLRAWTDHTPEPLLASYARARQAIDDAPRESGVDGGRWTPARVRATERTVTARGVRARVTCAVDRAETVVAFTEVWVGPRPGALASTEDTAVVADRRRLGLASWVKAESLRSLAADRPDVTRVTTANHETNAGMLAINRALGFVAVSRWAAAVVQL